MWGSGWACRLGESRSIDSSVYLDRLARVRAAMAEHDIDTLLLSVGHDLPYLTGYTAMPLERLTMLVVPRDAGATMVIPALEAPRVRDVPGVFDLLPWGETQDPTAIVARLAVRLAARRRRRPDVGPVPRRAAPAAPRCRVHPCRRRGRPAADGEGPGRDRCARRRRRRRRPDRRRTAARRDPARRTHRGRGVGPPRPAHHRGGPRQGQLRDRRGRRERGEPAPSRRDRG